MNHSDRRFHCKGAADALMLSSCIMTEPFLSWWTLWCCSLLNLIISSQIYQGCIQITEIILNELWSPNIVRWCSDAKGVSGVQQHAGPTRSASCWSAVASCLGSQLCSLFLLFCPMPNTHFQLKIKLNWITAVTKEYSFASAPLHKHRFSFLRMVICSQSAWVRELLL